MNGKPKTLADGSTIGDLIAFLGLRARSVVVERNGEPVGRSKFEALRLRDGDVLEVVKAVPGG